MMENYWKMVHMRNAKNNKMRKALQFYPLTDFKNPSEIHRLYLRYALDSHSILDFGAGDLSHKKFILQHGYNGTYKTLDISSGFTYDYKDISEVKEAFDLVFCLEVIEHLSLDTFLNLLKAFKKILNKNGKIIIATPNAYHVNFFWAADITHIRPYPCHDLCNLLDIHGYKNIIFHKVTRRTPLMKLFIKKILTHFLEVDYATNICVIAENS